MLVLVRYYEGLPFGSALDFLVRLVHMLPAQRHGIRWRECQTKCLAQWATAGTCRQQVSVRKWHRDAWAWPRRNLTPKAHRQEAWKKIKLSFLDVYAETFYDWVVKKDDAPPLGASVLSYHTKIVVWAIKTTEAHKASRISPVGVWPTLACNINRQGSKRMIDRPRAMAQLGLIHSSCNHKWRKLKNTAFFWHLT